jgi:L,D-peptidoglycan transpeptidase YkuD (ErfK/YbiS/YcfS/YnhG family)
MRRVFVSIGLFAILLFATRPGLAQDGEPLQMVVVTTAGWDATDAVLRRYARPSAGAPWTAVGEPVRAVVGRTGLAWGTGIRSMPDGDDGPVKREGDGKAPAGVFRLTSTFGYAPADSAAWIKLPYHPADASVECVDDSDSRFYNALVDRDTIAAPDWRSHEEMRRSDELYRWGVWVDHNTGPARPRGGSCIFLHVWRGPGQPTVGCTAMARADLEALLAWLDPRARPVLAQLPDDRYARLRAEWRLP